MLYPLASMSEEIRLRSNVVSSTIAAVVAGVRFETFHTRNGLCHATCSEDVRVAVSIVVADKITMSLCHLLWGINSHLIFAVTWHHSSLTWSPVVVGFASGLHEKPLAPDLHSGLNELLLSLLQSLLEFRKRLFQQFKAGLRGPSSDRFIR